MIEEAQGNFTAVEGHRVRALGVAARCLHGSLRLSQTKAQSSPSASGRRSSQEWRSAAVRQQRWSLQQAAAHPLAWPILDATSPCCRCAAWRRS